MFQGYIEVIVGDRRGDLFQSLGQVRSPGQRLQLLSRVRGLGADIARGTLDGIGRHGDDGRVLELRIFANRPRGGVANYLALIRPVAARRARLSLRTVAVPDAHRQCMPAA